MQELLLAIPKGKGPHAGATTQGWLQTPSLNRSQQGLGVCIPTPWWSLPCDFQFASKGEMIVNLSVESNHITAAIAEHRLVAGGAEFKDSQPLMGQSQANSRINPDAGIIRASVGNGCANLADTNFKISGRS
jgi:hypothetical protein